LILYYFVITMVGGKTQIRSSTTYDAIAIYTSEHPCEHWIIVLPSNRLFEGRVLCGTVFEDVNGSPLAWTTCEYMSFQGIVQVAKVERLKAHIR